MKILIVDDEKDIVDLVAYNLEKEGHEVLKAYDGERAIQSIRSKGPDLVILDLMLPHMNGLEVCRRLKENPDTGLIPVIMLTSDDIIVGVKHVGGVYDTLGTIESLTASVPFVPLHHMPVLLAEAAGLTLLSFSSTMLAARSFAEKNRYDVDADREVAALGAANVGAALSQGFAVTGSALRTSVAEASGARTQVAGLVAAFVLVPVLLFFTGPLQHIPSVALAAILISAGLSMLNWDELRAIHRIEPQEYWLAVIATAGVLVFGAIQAILLVVVLALLRFVRLTARPRVELLGDLGGEAGYQSIASHPAARSQPGLLLFRYNGPVVFFSAPHFKREVLAAAAAAGPELRWFVIDLLPVSQIDATGLFAIRDAFATLRARGIVVAAAGRDAEWADRASRRDLSGVLTGIRFFPTLRLAESAYREETRPSPPAAAPA